MIIKIKNFFSLIRILIKEYKIYKIYDNEDCRYQDCGYEDETFGITREDEDEKFCLFVALS